MTYKRNIVIMNIAEETRAIIGIMQNNMKIIIKIISIMLHLQNIIITMKH